MGDVEISFSLGKIKKFILIGFLVAVLAFELSVTMSSPIAFGDEGYHVTNARYVGTHVEYPHDTPLFGSELQRENFARPPLWTMTEGSFYMLFGFNDAIVKFLVPFLSFMTGLVIYVFLRKLYDENLAIIAAAVAVTIPSFVTYSIFFYTTVPYVFFFTLAFMSLLAAIKLGGRKYWLLAGLFSGISILTNIAGAFMVILTAVMGVLVLLKHRNLATFKHALKTYGLVILVSMLIISPWIARNVALYSLPECSSPLAIMQGTCQPVDTYVKQTDNDFVGRTDAGGTEQSIFSVGLTNYLRFAYGFSHPNWFVNLIGLAFVPFAFVAGLAIMAKRRDLADVMVIVSVLVFFAVSLQVGGFFEGRAEDAARYFLSAVPVIGLAAGTYWASIRKEGHRFNGLVVLAVIAIVIGFSFYGFQQKVASLDNIKNFVPSFFQACSWVKNNPQIVPEDANMLSLHTYPTRYNCERGAVWEIPDKADILLSNDVDLVKERLTANGIDFIFVQKFAMSNEFLGQAYPVSFVSFLDNNSESFVKIYENGPEFGTQEFIDCVGSGSCDPGNIIYRVV